MPHVGTGHLCSVLSHTIAVVSLYVTLFHMQVKAGDARAWPSQLQIRVGCATCTHINQHSRVCWRAEMRIQQQNLCSIFRRMQRGAFSLCQTRELESEFAQHGFDACSHNTV